MLLRSNRVSLFAVAFCAPALSLLAQINTTYTAGAAQRTFGLITGGQLLTSGTFDDAILYTTVPTFFFNGSYYSDMQVSTNGFITLGSAATATTYTPISGTGTYVGAISPFGANLKNATTGTPEIRWAQVNNDIVVQWQDVARQSGGTERFSFQAKIEIGRASCRERV